MEPPTVESSIRPHRPERIHPRVAPARGETSRHHGHQEERRTPAQQRHPIGRADIEEERGEPRP